MSDGPHKSLPLRQHWKNLAERAATPAYSLDEVAEAWSVALNEEMREVPLDQIRTILGGGKQRSLFNEECAAQLEAARGICRGSMAGTAVIDCALEAHAKGLKGDEAYEAAIHNAHEVLVRSATHSIDEHYKREDQPNAATVRERLDAGCQQQSNSIGSSASSRSEPSNARLKKRTGVDEGPPL